MPSVVNCPLSHQQRSLSLTGTIVSRRAQWFFTKFISLSSGLHLGKTGVKWRHCAWQTAAEVVCCWASKKQ